MGNDVAAFDHDDHLALVDQRRRQRAPEHAAMKRLMQLGQFASDDDAAGTAPREQILEQLVGAVGGLIDDDSEPDVDGVAHQALPLLALARQKTQEGELGDVDAGPHQRRGQRRRTGNDLHGVAQRHHSLHNAATWIGDAGAARI